MSTRRTRSMSHQEWTEIVLSYRTPEIERLVASLPPEETADLLAAYCRKDVLAVDRELTKLVSPP